MTGGETGAAATGRIGWAGWAGAGRGAGASTRCSGFGLGDGATNDDSAGRSRVGCEAGVAAEAAGRAGGGRGRGLRPGRLLLRDRLGADGLGLVEAGRDDGHADLVAEGVVDDRAEDDVGVGRGGVGDELRGLVDLEQAQVGAAGDRQQHTVGAVDAGLQQRAGDGHLGGGDRAVVAARVADAHEGRARART